MYITKLSNAFDGLVIYTVIITEAHGDGEHENYIRKSSDRSNIALQK